MLKRRLGVFHPIQGRGNNVRSSTCLKPASVGLHMHTHEAAAALSLYILLFRMCPVGNNSRMTDAHDRMKLKLTASNSQH